MCFSPQACIWRTTHSAANEPLVPVKRVRTLAPSRRKAGRGWLLIRPPADFHSRPAEFAHKRIKGQELAAPWADWVVPTFQASKL